MNRDPSCKKTIERVYHGDTPNFEIDFEYSFL
jgi:hypothetical protein